MIRFGATIALALAFTPHAMAQDDGRVASQAYVEDRVVPFAVRPGFQSTIQFGDDERIENIAVGESGAWQITPNRRANLIFVKTASAAAPVTNMTVVTDRHTYLFELRSGAKAQPVYLLRFTHPEEPVPVPEPAAQAVSPGIIAAAQSAALPLSELNFAWTMKGAQRLLPARVFDDGRSVYLSWPEGRALPAVLSIGPDGKTEGPVNYAADGDYIVVEGFQKKLVLRSGKDVAVLETARPAPADMALAKVTE